MASINTIFYMFATVNGKRYEFGSLSLPLSITAAGNDIHEFTRSVGTSSTLKVYDASISSCADFDYMLIAVDYDCMLELVTDDNNTVGDEFYTVPLSGTGRTNEYGIPFILTRDDSYANYGKNFASGTLDVIDLARVRNLSSTQIAQVMCLAFT